MSGWHAKQDVVARYANAPETMNVVAGSSLEAHLLSCDECRRGVAAAANPSTIAENWDLIADRIDRPSLGLAERVLGRFAPDHIARVVAATPGLRWSWLAAVAFVVTVAVVVSYQAGTSMPFLALAPLVPLASVAISFGVTPDPVGEAALATPLYGTGLLLRRAAAVVGTSMVMLVAGSLALPGLEPRDAGWVIPALGLTVVVLALATWVSLSTAAAAVAFGWLFTLGVAATRGPAALAAADSVLFQPAGQFAFAGLTILAAIVFMTRRTRIPGLEAV